MAVPADMERSTMCHILRPHDRRDGVQHIVRLDAPGSAFVHSQHGKTTPEEEVDRRWCPKLRGV